MRRCPISYLPIKEGHYSREGLEYLSPRLKELKDFPYGEKQQMELMLDYADKLSFSGVQPKLSAKLNVQKQMFEITQKQGTYLFKLPQARYSELPQNEDLTMKLAHVAGVIVPKHGMIYAKDQSLVYFIERFDRVPRQKLQTEDFGQLLGLNRDTKYDSSMEKVGEIVDKFCSFPILEKSKFFRLTLFNFLVGNEDMHVKNFTLLTRDGITSLSPAYDLVNSTIVIKTKEETALPLRGKKSNFKRVDLVDYFGGERLGLSGGAIQEVLDELEAALKKWHELIEDSFLSEENKKSYFSLLTARSSRLFV